MTRSVSSVAISSLLAVSACLRREALTNMLSECMGGIPPPFTSIESKMRAGIGLIVEAKRMPPGVSVLRDPKWWTRTELNDWVRHILKGQAPDSDVSKRFQWHTVPCRSGEPQIIARTYQSTPHASSSLEYSPNELLYARRVQLQQSLSTPEMRLASWNSLPVARTVEVYAAYRIQLFQFLLQSHSDNQDMCELIRMVARMETFGPAHVRSNSYSLRQRYFASELHGIHRTQLASQTWR